jgi:hypothetical protein
MSKLFKTSAASRPVCKPELRPNSTALTGMLVCLVLLSGLTAAAFAYAI